MGRNMFHVEHISQAARYAGMELDPGKIVQFERYMEWLNNEAIPAGGLGPGESGRLEQRHIADSLLFASCLDDPGNAWDLGSGVGLPGIPLALGMPNTHWTLFDRSGRRVDLLKRAQRILHLDNVDVKMMDINRLEGNVEAIVSRATLPPEVMLPVFRRLLLLGGTGVVGGSWHTRPESEGWETLEIPSKVLDRTVWLLMMRQE